MRIPVFPHKLCRLFKTIPSPAPTPAAPLSLLSQPIAGMNDAAPRCKTVSISDC